MRDLPISDASETILEEPDGSLEELARAGTDEEVAAVAGRHPSCLAAWAELGERALRVGAPVQAYAYFRVGYHRGLDRLRKGGWRGSGLVRWEHATNRGFLKSLRGLGAAAGEIGEIEEQDRCRQFLADLAPDAPSAG